MIQPPVRPLHSDADYQEALAQFEAFFDHEPAPGSDASDRFELLGLVIAKYEDDRFAIEDADPVEVLKLVMEGRGLEQKDLAQVLGSAPRASEILNRKRDLNLDQIRKISRAWSIPADALIGMSEHA
jgi:antitoxin component HigA of HigAB toxin-antitoxin module